MAVKVLHVIWNAKFGGIERLVYDLATAQNESPQVEAHVMIAKKEGELLEQFEQSTFQINCFNIKGGSDLNFQEYNKIRASFKAYDILHFHFFNPLLSAAAFGLGCKIVYTEHGNFGLGRVQKVSDIILKVLKTFFLKNLVSWTTYNSHFTRKTAEDLYGIKNLSNTSVVYNGIHFPENNEEPQFDELKALTDKLAGKFVVGTSSRFVAFKRIDRLITAFSKLKNLEESVLLLVGDGVLMPKLKAQVEQLGLVNHVVFSGYVGNVRHYQKLMDVCVFPSQKEPFGLVAIETLAFNKPTVVFSDGGGIKEIIEKIAIEDIVSSEAELTERLNQYQNSSAGEIKSEVSRVDYAKTYNIEATSKQFAEIYLQLL